MSANELLSKEILNAKEAAAFLSISLQQLYKLSANGTLPTYCPTGGRIYFKKSEIEEWVFSKRRASVKNINTKAYKFLNNKQL